MSSGFVSTAHHARRGGLPPHGRPPQAARALRWQPVKHWLRLVAISGGPIRHNSDDTRTGPVEADGAVDAQNAPTAPWKTLRVFHELPQGFPHPITHDKPRKSPESYWETRIDPSVSTLKGQGTMTKPAMLDDLPTDCAGGTKKNSKGYKETWIGYKLHIDVADGQIPISCILTSASLHDSQAAIPLATVSAERTTNLYDLMDAAYDAQPVREYSRSLGHVPLIDINTRGNTVLAEERKAEGRRLERMGSQRPEDVRYHERTAGERVNGRLKDEFGARHVRVRRSAKVMCQCMFGVLALTADQLMRLVT